MGPLLLDDDVEQAPVNPTIITWARKRIGLSYQELATSRLPAEMIKAWEEGDGSPTDAQAELLADRLRVPLLVLFLSDPPNLDVPLQDFRTVSGESPLRLSADFVDAANDAIARQEWFRDYQIRRGSRPLPFVGRFTIHDSIETVAKGIAAALGLNEQLRNQAGSWEQFLRAFVSNAEDKGILVMRSALVRHATNRRLSTDEFRGFALSDKVAPLVFINGDDAKAAQTFTLAHELAHIWIGQSGISNPNLRKRLSDITSGIEKFCNRVAAELLVPRTEFFNLWRDSYLPEVNIRAVATSFRVSTLVAIRRAFEFDKISRDQFMQMMEQEYRRFNAIDNKEKENEEQPERGNFWASFVNRNSPRFTSAIVGEVSAGRIAFTQGAYLLGIQSGSLDHYLQYLAREH